MNVALQSFVGEPWAIALRPTDELGNDSFHSNSGATVPDAPRVPLTTTAAARVASDSLGSSTTSVARASSPHQSQTTYGGRLGSGVTAAARCGVQLGVLDHDADDAAFMDADGTFSFESQAEEMQVLQQCVQSVNDPPVTYGNDELLARIAQVEFVPSTMNADPNGDPAAAAAMDGQVHYRLRNTLEPTLTATLQPAVTAVVERCVNAMVLVYGATQEMKQMGVIGTPEECGLVPHGIRLLMERYSERKEQQSRQRRTSLPGGATATTTTTTTPPMTGDGIEERLPDSPSSVTNNMGSGLGTALLPGDGSTTRSAGAFVFPHIGSSTHRFARLEATFIAFDSSTVVDLLDLNNKHVELVLKLAPPPTPAAFEETGTDDMPRGNAASSSPTTDSFVINARSMSAESTNDALSALDVGLENLSRALEMTLLQSESGSSLLFSLTAYTDTCRSATLHMLCLAEDPAAQTWLASTVLARSQAIPLGEEQSWASIQNTPMPPPLHHHAATMLVPSLCFGNMFTSVLICVYNSITALGRLNRDLTFAVTGYRMRTIPRVTLASSRSAPHALPVGWEEHFTEDGRRYYIDTSTQTTTWEDPRLAQRASSSSASGARAQQLPGSAHRPGRIGLSDGDKDYLAAKLAGQSTPAPGSMTPSAATPLDIGIVVVDTQGCPRVVLRAQNAEFAAQFAEEEEAWEERQRRMAEKQLQLQQQQLQQAAVAALPPPPSGSEPSATTPSLVGGMVSADGGTGTATATTTTAATTASSVVSGSLTSTVASQQQQPLSTASAPLPLCSQFHPDLQVLPGSTAHHSVTAGEEWHKPGLQEGGSQQASSNGPEGLTATPAYPRTVTGEEDTDDAAEEEEEAFALERSATSTMGDFETDDIATLHAAKEEMDNVINTGRFYNNALQEQVAMPTSEPCGTSVCGNPVGSGNPAASPPTLSAISTEMQDLESLVDEFSRFYRRAYRSEQRLAELEALVAAHPEVYTNSAASSTSNVAGVGAGSEGAETAAVSGGTVEGNSGGDGDGGESGSSGPALLRALEAGLSRIGTTRMRQTLGLVLNKARKLAPRGVSAFLPEVWESTLMHVRDTEEVLATQIQAEHALRLQQLAVDHQFLLQRTVQSYEMEIQSLKEENSALRQSLPASQIRALLGSPTTPIGVPSLPDLLLRHQELFSTALSDPLSPVDDR